MTLQPTQARLHFARPDTGWKAQPLEQLTVTFPSKATLVVRDGQGKEYVRVATDGETQFVAGGALGMHVAQALDDNGQVIDQLHFQMDAGTQIHDQGNQFHDFLAICDKTMRCYHPSGATEKTFGGKKYRFYVHWILDHSHTEKGMRYFSDANADLVDLEREYQREDGMIWSFIDNSMGFGFWQTRDAGAGDTRVIDGTLLVRQPTENHCEYNFVDAMYLAWKASGDDAWMQRQLDAATRALDYTVNDRSRWSSQFGLLKRGYTIDSWDFQVNDEYTVEFPIGTDMKIDADRTKFGAFNGDNTGYAYACDQLAEMLLHGGRKSDARKYAQRGKEIRERLDAIAWNGKFYRHRVEEDPAVKRNLGVDEKSQIVMSNAYAINRNIDHQKCVAILNTYLDLKDHLPGGSAGEWYAIYPPFGRGFGDHNGKWQYMNGGVHGHAAGELALGAFDHGYEQYGANILLRMLDLGRKHGNMVRFAYTGAYEAPPPPQLFTPIDLSAQANMDLWDKGAAGVAGWMGSDPGNDMRNLPVGAMTLQGVPYQVIDPRENNRRAVVAVSRRKGFAEQVEIPLGGKTGAVYLLHTANGITEANVVAGLTFKYEDGSDSVISIQANKHLVGWWFPSFNTPNAGVAWQGPNEKSTDVGICWAAIANPQPEKMIKSLVVTAALDGPIYALAGLTLADRMPYQRPDPVSFGGPDNWSGGTCCRALVEGLAGVADKQTALSHVRLSPRWISAGVNCVDVTARYPASTGYISYRYRHDPAAKKIEMLITGGGKEADLRILLPGDSKGVSTATVDGKKVTPTTESVEKSNYAVVPVPLGKPIEVTVNYK